MRIGLAGVGRIGAFHAETLRDLSDVDEVVVADLDADAARTVADKLEVGYAASPAELLASGVDGFVIATATPGHAPLIRLGLEAGVPTFCEKPVAATLEETLDLAELVSTDRHARSTSASSAASTAATSAPGRPSPTGSSASSTRIRAKTHDQAPPHAAYIPTSGGLFRDCSIHDFDIVRFVTGPRGRLASSPPAPTRARRSSPRPATSTPPRPSSPSTTARSSRCRPPATTAAATTSAWRSSAARARIGVGYDDSLAVTSAEPGVDLPVGPATLVVHGALPARLPRRADRLRRRGPRRSCASPCTVHDALQAFRVAEACELSRHEDRPVALDEIPACEGRDHDEHPVHDTRRPATTRTTSSRSGAPASTSTRSSTASASRTCGPSRSSSAAARPTSPSPRPATGAGPPSSPAPGDDPFGRYVRRRRCSASASTRRLRHAGRRARRPR